MTKPKRRYLFYLIKFHDESIVCILYCRGIGGAVVTATVTSAVGLITHERACYHLIISMKKLYRNKFILKQIQHTITCMYMKHVK